MYEKVGIITIYDNWNIGNRLQNYAVQELCRKYSKRVYSFPNVEFDKMLRNIGIKGHIIRMIGFPKDKYIIKNAINRRNKNFLRFSKEYISKGKKVKFAGPSKKIIKNIDKFIVGSDQVWHNWSHTHEELRYFFLKFTEKQKRICISPSFGFDILPEKFEKEYINGFNGFEILSCREDSGCEMIYKSIKRQPIRLIDPTFCLKIDEWNRIAKKPNYIIPQKYILVYILGDYTETITNQVNELKRIYKLPIIDIYNLKYPEYYSTSPDEFIYLIQKAEIIYTNSFHGLAFSLQFHKKVSLCNREDKEGSKMNDRISTLLKVLEIKDINQIDYKSVDQKIIYERKKMQEYLDNVFNE